MAKTERFSNPPDYLFPHLRTLLAGIAPGDRPMVMTIGQPRHAFLDFLGKFRASADIQLLSGACLDHGPSDDRGHNFIRRMSVAVENETRAAPARLKNCLYKGG